ncbi:MAG TPA: pilus assembly protein PilQ [Candidatus Megamonas gallistercoris]|nr:pilus assembly protein PilQ [Candidatus Megamonas gallistercoris]
MAVCIILSMNTVQANSIDVAGADIRQVLTAIASGGNLNLVLDDTVKGNVSVKLADLSPQEMIRIIAQSNNYICDVRSGIIYISRDNRQKTLQNIRINYLELDKAAQMVNLLLEKGILSNGDKKGEKKTDGLVSKVIVDKNENTITFYATNEEYDKIKKFIKENDVPPRQVSLEAKVTAVQNDAAKDLGITWEWSKFPQSPSHDITYDTITHTTQNSDGSYSQTTDYLPVDEVRRSWNGSDLVPGVIRFGKGPEGYPYELYYEAKLSALISEGKANILARPNIMTVQGNEAVINIGSEVPVPTVATTNATTTTSIEYREAGIILKCTPRVNEDGIITVKVHTEVSSPLYVEDMKAYRFQKRSADTIVRLRDGETMVIGGLIGKDEAKQMSKVPFLGDIPILGNLFKHIQKSKTDSEIMIFLTAKEVK